MINEKKDACYHKVKSRYSVWPSAYASGALVKCRKKGAKNWGNSRKDEALHTAYFNFAAVLLEVTARGVGRVAGRAVERLKQSGASEAEVEAKQEQERRLQLKLQNRASERAEKYKPGSGDKASEVAGERFMKGKRAGRSEVYKPKERRNLRTRPPEGSDAAIAARAKRDPQAEVKGRIARRRADFEDAEARAQAAARGTSRRKRFVRGAKINPKTGRVDLDIDQQGVIPAMARGALERVQDRIPGAVGRAITAPVRLPAKLAAKGIASAAKGIASTPRSIGQGRASQRAKRRRIDFSTEYQRIGEILAEAKGVMPKKFSVKSGDKSAAGGLTAKGVRRYRAANPGSKLKTAVTTKPSKLKKGSKSANRRKSFCARMGGMKKRLTSSKTANDPNSRINKALRKWNC